MSKKGLPVGLKMRHDSHYVDELAKSPDFIGRVISISKIEPNPTQPRVEMGDLSELVDSIKEKGVLEPLLVKPLKGLDKWLIIAGERRWRASQIAGLRELPCIELDVTDQEVAEIALIENLQRKDLTVWEEADAYQALCQRFDYTHDDLAKRLGKSRSSVTETLTVANLPSVVKEKCRQAGIFSKAAILKIARKFDEDEMFEEVNKEINKNISHNRTQQKGSFVNSDFDSETNVKTKALPKIELENPTGGGIGQTNHFLVNFPLRVYKVKDNEYNFQFEIKFKKPAGLNELKKAIHKILYDLNNIND